MKYELPSTELIVIEENNYLKFGEYLNDMQCDDTTNKLCLDDLEYVKKLQQENKILRENAEHNDKVVDKVNWENQLLKKQLEEYKDKINWYENFEVNKTIDKLRIKHNNQQKEFIEYLENMLDDENDIFSVVRVKDVLQKYKETIGVSDEKEN